MLSAKAGFSGFSVNDLAKAKDFYTGTLGLKLIDDAMGLRLALPGGSGETWIYPKDDHQPATYTNLNFVVADIKEAVSELTGQGVKFEQYEGTTDEQGIAYGKERNMGPNIAWFKDPAGNILALIEE